ncbi:MAG: bifunctional 5,10-methylenetetrahydrofolate dehydrogenase/5,10-methenyltetrahydrofolate cyclohydrolase [Thermoanaerobaculia bacterium]
MSTPVILKGKPIAAAIRSEVAAEVEKLTADRRRAPKLVAVLVGDNPASKTYVASKTKSCAAAGMASETLRLAADTRREELSHELARLNADESVDGILVQLPLPDHLPEREILAAVAPDKDVDGFHPENVGRLWSTKPGGELTGLTPATPTGVIEMLRRYEIGLAGRHAVVVGRSNIVGKPMAALLLRESCTVTVCHSRTRNLEAVCQLADILIVAIGRTAMIGPEHVRDGAVVVDIGINRVTDAVEVERLYPGDAKRRAGFERRGYTLAGDVDFHRVAPRCAAITPVPGGVGRLTVAQLLVNTLAAYRRRRAPG